MSAITLDRAIDAAMQLSLGQQEMLLKVIQRRHIEARRAEIAQDAQASLAAFRDGKLEPQTADQVIDELCQALEDAT